MEEKEEIELPESNGKGVIFGQLAGKGYAIPDGFNDPLPDLEEYM